MRAAEEQPPPSSIVQYDNAVSEPLQHFMSLCSKIGGDADTVTGNVRAVFTAQRNLIWTAAGQQEMPPAQLQGALQPVSQKLDEISAFRETRRNTPLFNLLSSIADGIQAIGWLAVKPTPAPFIKEMIDAAMFFVNRVLKEKARDSDEAECSKAWIATLNALHLYVRQGSSPTSASSNSSVPQPPPGPPPPPPPPPMPMGLLSTGDKKTDNAAREALFADLNRGLDVTKGLKKVTADMQTHKNPTLKQQGPVVSTGTAPSSKSANASGSATAVMQKKTPRIELENGKQWNVEFHVGNKNLEIEVTDMKQTMYIYQCTDSMIRVKGKLNSITLDGCRKTGVVVDSLVSQIEIINCQSMQIQTLGHLPMISIQKTDGCQMILSKESMKAEFVTSKSSEMNIMIPTSDGDFIELPIPEQFKTVYDGKRLVTTVSDIV